MTSVLVVGAGPAGLVNARTLIDDGFDVTIVAKEATIGGCWANTYPDLTSNSPWGALTFSGLDMPKPSNWDGAVVPARTYQRYLEDFYEWFVNGKAAVYLETEVTELSPRPNGARGWDALFKDKQGESKHTFDRVVLAAGFLGKPRLHPVLKSSPIPVFHSSQIAHKPTLDTLLGTVAASPGEPTPQGGPDTVVVVGGGKSGMDIAALLANRGRKVVWAFNCPLKWFAPTVAPGSLGAGRLDIMMGPWRVIDSWAMWFFHCTHFGAKYVRAFWAVVGGFWKTLYTGSLQAPNTDPFLTLAHFAGGISSGPTDFLALVKAGKIAVLPDAALTSTSTDGATFATRQGSATVRCGAIVAATGYSGGMYSFVPGPVRKSLGLERRPPAAGWQARVKAMRDRWVTVGTPPGYQEIPISQPMIFRGLLPVGRFEQRDLATAGGTRPFGIPAIAYEVESHWISSVFKDDPFMRLPKDKQAFIDETNKDNEFNMARYPGVDPYEVIPDGTYFSGFNDLAHTRLLLRDLSLDPWRQKSKGRWWRRAFTWDWIDVRLHPEQYATLREERRVLRAQAQAPTPTERVKA